MIDLSYGTFFTMYNVANPRAQLSPATAIFSAPIEKPVDWPGDGNGNSLVRITPTSETPLVGSEVFEYNRIDLADIGNTIGLTVQAPVEVVTIHDLIPAILQSRGVLIHPTDVEDGPIDRTDPNNVTVVLKATATALMLKGEVTLTVKEGPVDVASVIRVTELEGIKVIASDKTVAEYYSYPNDLSRFSDILENATEIPTLAIIAGLGDIWTDAPGPYSLSGAAITYNGPVSDNLTTHAMHVTLSADCTSHEGKLILNYNVGV